MITYEVMAQAGRARERNGPKLRKAANVQPGQVRSRIPDRSKFRYSNSSVKVKVFEALLAIAAPI